MADDSEKGKAHRTFAAESFNQAWDYIDTKERSAADVETMIHAAHASLWHWMQVPDHTDQHVSVGLWQLSRVYALASNPAEAARYGHLSLDAAERGRLAPFYLAYAYEALARAAVVGGFQKEAAAWLEKADAHAAGVTDGESRKLLEADLAGLR